MAVIHITEAEATRDLPNILSRVRAGDEVLIGDGIHAVHMHQLDSFTFPGRPMHVSEAIEYLKEHGSNATLDADFSKDLEAIIEGHSREVIFDPWAV